METTRNILFINARYNGNCRQCGGPTYVGQRIGQPRNLAEKAWFCETCALIVANNPITLNPKRELDRQFTERLLPFTPVIPDGSYSVVYPNGEYRTLRFRTGKRDGSNKGLQRIGFIDNDQHRRTTWFGWSTPDGGVRFWRKVAAELGEPRCERIRAALQRVAAAPEEAGIAYALKCNRCYHCDKELTQPVSICRGLGPVCAGKGISKKQVKGVYEELAAQRARLRSAVA